MNITDIKGKATWELRSIVKALSGPLSMFNDDNDTRILEVATKELKKRESTKSRTLVAA